MPPGNKLTEESVLSKYGLKSQATPSKPSSLTEEDVLAKYPLPEEEPSLASKAYGLLESGVEKTFGPENPKLKPFYQGAQALGEGFKWAQDKYMPYTSYPLRTGMQTLAEREPGLLTQKVSEQFGESGAPSGKDIARYSGLTDKPMSERFPEAFSESGFGFRLKKGGLLDVSPAGVAGGVIDVATDPLSYAGLLGGKKVAPNVVSAADEAILAGGRKIRDVTPGLIKEAKGMLAAPSETGRALIKRPLPPVTPEVLEGADALGIPREQISNILLLEGDKAKRAMHSLETDPRIGGLLYGKEMAPIESGLEASAGTALSEATPMRPHETGLAAQESIAAQAARSKAEFEKVYQGLEDVFGNKPISKPGIARVKKSLMALAEEPGIDAELSAPIQRALIGLDKVKDIKGLTQLKTRLSQSLPQNASPALRNIIGEIDKSLGRLRENSVKLASKEVKYDLGRVLPVTSKVPDLSTISGLQWKSVVPLAGEGTGYGRWVDLGPVSVQRVPDNPNMVELTRGGGQTEQLPFAKLGSRLKELDVDGQIANAFAAKEQMTGGITGGKPGLIPTRTVELDFWDNVFKDKRFDWKNGIKRIGKFNFKQVRPGVHDEFPEGYVRIRDRESGAVVGDVSKKDLGRWLNENDPTASVAKELRAKRYKVPSEAIYEQYPGAKVSEVPKEALAEIEGIDYNPKSLNAKFVRVSPEEYVAQRSKNKRQGFLSQSSPMELRNHQVFMTQDGVGYALSPEGDLQGLFNNSGRKNAGKEALIHAIANGAKTLDAFQGHLTSLYNDLGFTLKKTSKWDDKYAPQGWDYERYGKPDVVYMEYPKSLSRDPEAVASRLAAARAQRLARASGSRGPAPGIEFSGKHGLIDWKSRGDVDLSEQAKATGRAGASSKLVTGGGLLKEANQLYREFAVGEQKASPWKLSRKEGAHAFSERVKNIEPASVRKTLISSTNPDRNAAFKEAYPEAFDILRRGELARLKALSSDAKTGKIEARKLINELYGQTKGVPKYDPVVIKQIFGAEGFKKIQAMKKILDQYPRDYTPSQTPKGQQYLINLFTEPGKSLGSAYQYMKLKARAPSIPKGLLKKDK